jgi:hypothetical protein
MKEISSEQEESSTSEQMVTCSNGGGVLIRPLLSFSDGEEGEQRPGDEVSRSISLSARSMIWMVRAEVVIGDTGIGAFFPSWCQFFPFPYRLPYPTKCLLSRSMIRRDALLRQKLYVYG